MYNLEVHKQSLSLLYCKEENGPTEAAGHKEKAKEESHYILGHAFSCKRVIAGRVFSKNVHNDLENTRFPASVTWHPRWWCIAMSLSNVTLFIPLTDFGKLNEVFCLLIDLIAT